ncbi:MAG: hypothetical protein U1E00_02360 [Pseudoxanthomonas sp.]|jgi:hypothetical protein|nr:hypothetical protein [Pseudoxanthomonas sp.]
MSRIALRLLPVMLSCLFLFALSGCAAPASSDGVATDPPPASTPVPKPTGGNLPPREAGAVTVDYSCRTSADCAVKNVGNCCGAMPACVNKDSPTDPQGVQAQCAASGRMGVCGFADVTACQCVSGRCESDSSSLKIPTP